MNAKMNMDLLLISSWSDWQHWRGLNGEAKSFVSFNEKFLKRILYWYVKFKYVSIFLQKIWQHLKIWFQQEYDK